MDDEFELGDLFLKHSQTGPLPTVGPRPVCFHCKVDTWVYALGQEGSWDWSCINCVTTFGAPGQTEIMQTRTVSSLTANNVARDVYLLQAQAEERGFDMAIEALLSMDALKEVLSRKENLSRDDWASWLKRTKPKLFKVE